MAIPTRQQFAQALSGSPMQGEADAIYDAAVQGGINPAFVAGLASAESSFGSAGYARGTNNPYGLGVHLGWKFNNYADATRRLGETLNDSAYRNLYNTGGLGGVVSRYTPRSDGNNEQQHAANIRNGGGRTGGDASQVYLNGQVPASPSTGDPLNTTGGLPGLGNGNGSKEALALDMISNDDEDEDETTFFKKVVNAAMAEQMTPVGTSVPGQPATAQPQQGGGVGIIPNDGTQPGLSKWGGPDDHGARALGNWQSDMAWDLGGPAGTAVYSPLAGTVIKVSDWDDRAQFRGQGVTIDHGNGNQGFYKHLGNVAVRAGQQVGPGTLLGGLADGTGGGPHLHLGGSSNAFLESLLGYYLR